MLVLLLLGVLLLWKLQDYLFTAMWDRNLSVELQFQDSHIYEGDDSVLREIVVNDKRFPLPALHVRLIIPREFAFRNEDRDNTTVSDQLYKRDIFSFIGRQKITRNLHFVCDKRGFYELNSVDMVGGDFFLREGRYRSLPQNASIYVFPRQISTSQIQILCREISGTVMAQNRLHPDPFEFSGIRDYVKTDPMNHVNWKASARMGSLMVNQFDSTTNINVTVLLDVEDSGILKRERLVEEGIRIASSLAGRMANRKMPLRLVGNARISETDGLDLYLPAGGAHMLEMNQRLACIDSSKLTSSGEEMVERINSERVSGHTYVLITANTAEGMRKKAAALAAGSNQIIWVSTQYNDEDPVQLEQEGIRFLRWEVSRW